MMSPLSIPVVHSVAEKGLVNENEFLINATERTRPYSYSGHGLQEYVGTEPDGLQFELDG